MTRAAQPINSLLGSGQQAFQAVPRVRRVVPALRQARLPLCSEGGVMAGVNWLAAAQIKQSPSLDGRGQGYVGGVVAGGGAAPLLPHPATECPQLCIAPTGDCFVHSGKGQ